jgi:cytochrome P450
MLSWAYYYLCSHPDCNAKLKAEHDVVFGTDTDPEAIARKIKSNPSILAKLEYTLAVLKESLRLRPIGDGVRYASPGYCIHTATGADFDVTGTILNIQHGGLHTLEEIWGDTAAEFDPERFMGGKTVPIGYMPFATRPRDCIGRNLAYLEVCPGSVPH